MTTPDPSPPPIASIEFHTRLTEALSKLPYLPGEIAFLCGGAVGTMVKLEAEVEMLRRTRDPAPTTGEEVREALLAAVMLADATLLFHSGGPWDDDKARRWRQSVGGDLEATTKTLGDIARTTKVLVSSVLVGGA